MYEALLGLGEPGLQQLYDFLANNWISLVTAPTAPFLIKGVQQAVRWVRKKLREAPVVEATDDKRTRVRPWKRVLLRPASNFDADELRRIGRMPLEPCPNEARTLGFFDLMRHFLLRPSTPKPAFLIRTWAVERAADQIGSPNEFTPGGSCLILQLHPNENRRHLVRSIRAGPTPQERTLAICDSGDLQTRAGMVTCFTVDALSAETLSDDKQSLSVYASDPLYSPDAWPTARHRGDVPEDATWLVQVEPHCTTDDESTEAIQPSVATCNLVSIWPAFRRKWADAISYIAESPHDPWIRRIARYLVFLALAAIPVFLILTIFVIAALLQVSWTSDWVAISLIYFATGITSISWCSAMLFALSHLHRYLASESFRRRDWNASTTRCLADGARIRNGFPGERRRKRAEWGASHS